ncbi:nuclear factor 7, ovary-like isoform X2 [Danio rerio]
MMKEKLKEMNTHISALSHTITDTEEMLKANDVCFLKEFPVSMERVQISQPDPQMPSGALIHVSRYLGNLPFRVWKKMQDIVQYTPVILNPNTAHPELELSDDLTRVTIKVDILPGVVGLSTANKYLSLFDDLISVTNRGNKQLLPDNPERFDRCLCVLGSKGFNSGKHCWVVEVKESQYWTLGVTTASNQRKGGGFFNSNVWSVYKYQYGQSGSSFCIKQALDRVRVDLDYDRGTVSFSDPVNNKHLHTYTTTFTDTLYPLFGCYESFFANTSSSLKILPFSRI